MKEYTRPVAEKIEFSYEEQIVASRPIGIKYAKQEGGPCEEQSMRGDYVFNGV